MPSYRDPAANAFACQAESRILEPPKAATLRSSGDPATRIELGVSENMPRPKPDSLWNAA
jgi:hypothetical protein